MTGRALVVGILLAALPACASYSREEGRSYAEKGESAASLFDLYRPAKGQGPRPALIAIHGGAWVSGNRGQMDKFAEELCPRGYAVVSIDYRLAPGAKWPAQLEDCRAAYRYVKAHARELGIDPARIGVVGVSAGAHLATMLELRDDPAVPGREGRPALAVEVDGGQDIALAERGQTQFPEIMEKLLGHPAPWSKAELDDLSTIGFARKDASVFLVHGANDPNVFVVNSDELAAALKDKGADMVYVRLEGADGDCHSNCWRNPKAREALFRFLDERLHP